MIFFRADGNQIIGSGHIMRCLSLAAAFRRVGEECRFILSDGTFASFVRKNGFLAEILDSDYTKMESGLSDISFLYGRLKPKLIIVDSYYVTERYLRELKRLCPVIYIDDLAAFAYPADGLVNYNIFGRYTVYEKLYRDGAKALPQLFLGPAYAPLREEFQQSEVRPQPYRAYDVLISAGGADPVHLISDCLRFLKKAGGAYEEFRFHFIVGAMNKDAEQIIIAAEDLKNAVIHKNVKRMGELMRQCDLAVAAAGSTLYELCACGVPTITYVLADNQIEGAYAFEKEGMMVSLGDIRKQPSAPEAIFQAVGVLAGDLEKRKEMSVRMRECVDARGADRLAAALLEAAGRNN